MSSNLLAVWVWATAAIGAAVLWLVYRWSVATYDHFARRNVLFSRPLPLLGNMAAMMTERKTSLEIGLELYERFKAEPFYGIFRFRRPILVITDPQLLRSVLVKDFDHFTNHHDILLPAEQEPLLGNALIMLKDQKWRDMRSTMSAAFTGSKMRHMFQLIQSSVDGAVEALEAECADHKEDYVPELKDRFVRFMTDVIASTAFGVEINSLRDRNNVFFTMGQKAIHFKPFDLVRVGVMAILPRISQALGLQMFAPAIHQFFHSVVHDGIAHRREHGVQRPDVINLLMETRREAEGGDSGTGRADATDASNQQPEEGAFAIAAETSAGKLRGNGQRVWSDAELTAQCFVFFVAGFETSSTVLSCAAQELAENQQVQQRLRAEIDAWQAELPSGAAVDYERLQRMPYMDQVVSEALRKWPPTAVTDRVCVQPFELVTDDGRRLKLAVGDVVMVSMLGMHRDERWFAEPMRFDPERFSRENRDKVVPFTYLPFGGGPRSCIASRFALITIKAMLYQLLSKFELHVAPSTQIPLRLMQRGFATTAERGFNVHLRPRSV